MRALFGRQTRNLQRAVAVCLVAALGLPSAAFAEVTEVQIVRGFAIPHLPIMIMEHDKLLEKHALAAGLGLPPFQYAELKVPGIHTLASSNDIMGGPHTFTMVYATGKFHDANPKTYQAFLAAIKEAIATINRDKSGVARTYIEMTHSKESLADIVAILDDPGTSP